MRIIYTIPAPYSMSETIEVYVESENGGCEWRIVGGKRIVRDTGSEGRGAFKGRQYGNAEIALRDALMFASGLVPPIDEESPDPPLAEIRRSR